MAPRSLGQDRIGTGHKAVSRIAYRYLTKLSAGYFRVDSGAKRAILDRIASGDLPGVNPRASFPTSAFDMVQVTGLRRFNADSLSPHQVKTLSRAELRRLRFVEVKGTTRARDKSLKDVFFSLQYAEQLAAQALGRRYRIVFVAVRHRPHRSFHVALKWQQVWSRARSIHVQFSIRF